MFATMCEACSEVELERSLRGVVSTSHCDADRLPDSRQPGVYLEQLRLIATAQQLLHRMADSAAYAAGRRGATYVEIAEASGINLTTARSKWPRAILPSTLSEVDRRLVEDGRMCGVARKGNVRHYLEDNRWQPYDQGLGNRGFAGCDDKLEIYDVAGIAQLGRQDLAEAEAVIRLPICQNCQRAAAQDRSRHILCQAGLPSSAGE